MKQTLQRLTKELFFKFGIDIKRLSISQNQSKRLICILENYNINIVFDIGANSGQFGLELRKMGYLGKIISFEPLSEPYKQLCLNAKNDDSWLVAQRAAIGSIEGEIKINIAGNSASSSILQMLVTHEKAAPNTKNIGIEITTIKKLDSISTKFLNCDSILFIKIDTQGYEDEVLNGGINTIQRATVLQLELSLVELYNGQKLFIEIVNKVNSMGFDLWGIEPAFIDSSSGRMLQVDAIFINNNIIKKSN